MEIIYSILECTDAIIYGITHPNWFYIPVLVFCIFLNLLMQLYDAYQNQVIQADKNIFKSIQYYFYVNVKNTFIQIIVSLFIIFYNIEDFITIFLLICLAVITYLLHKKTEDIGYTDNLFDIVEVFSFSTVLVRTKLGLLICVLFLFGFIVIANLLSNQYKSDMFINVLSLIEFAGMFLIDYYWHLSKSFYLSILFILIPYSLLKLLNELMLLIRNKYSE